MKLIKLIPIYIKISADKVEITNLKTGKTISKKSSVRFSTKRILLADFNVIQNLITDILKQLITGNIFPAQMKVLIQQVEEIEGGLTEIEKRALRDLGEQAGGTTVKLIEHFRKLSDEEVLQALDSKDN